MKKLAIAAITLLAVIGTARADSVLVLNSEEASYSILSRSTRTELARLPVGREPHHLVVSPDGKDVLIGSTATNELLVLDSKTGERRRVVRDIIDPYHLGFSPNGKWFVTVAYRLDHVDIFHADGFKLAGRVFIDGLPSHMTFDAGSNTVFITLQQSGRLAAFDLATQTVKWNVPVGNTPAGVLMLPDDKRVLLALTGEDGVVKKLHGVRLEWKKDSTGKWQMSEIPGSEFEIDCDLCLLAMGFVSPEHPGPIQQLKLDLDARGNAKVDESYMTSVPGVFAAGDMRRGQSLVVWAISEGRQAARGVDEFLMGRTELPYLKLF